MRRNAGAFRYDAGAFTACRAAAVLVLLALAAPALPAQDYGAEKPTAVPEEAVPLTAEEEKLLAAIDVRITGVEALAAKIDDAAYRTSVDASIADLKKRRVALGRKFDAGLYEVLMHAVISRYQVVALWLTPPREFPRAARPASSAAASTASANASSTSAGKSERKTAAQ